VTFPKKPHEKLSKRRLKFSPRISGGCIPRGSSLLDSHRANPEMEFGKDPNKVQEDRSVTDQNSRNYFN